MREAQELAEPTEQYSAQPLDDNLFEWHFTIRGPSDSDFAGGIYHGRIILPPDYPMKPPSIIFLTANGRFDCFTKICLSISKHHPESWQPSWSIRTALLAIIGFMPSPGHGAIGSLDYTKAERNALAKKSTSYVCEQCGSAAEKLLPLTSKSDETKKEIMSLGAQLSMTAEKSKTDTTQPKQEPVGDVAANNLSLQSSPAATDLRQRHASPEDSADSKKKSDADSEPQETNDVQGVDRRNAPTGAPTSSSLSSSSLGSAARSLQGPQQRSQQGSRSCLNSLTYWSLVFIGLLLILLIMRRFFLRYKSILDMLGMGTDDEL